MFNFLNRKKFKDIRIGQTFTTGFRLYNKVEESQEPEYRAHYNAVVVNPTDSIKYAYFEDDHVVELT